MENAYDALAALYDSHWGTAFLSRAVHAFETHLSNRVPAGASILDLCCGAGHFSGWLERHGMQVTGVDSSRELIVYAQRRAPLGQFYCRDMRDFALDERGHDAAVCYYNSLNHLMSAADFLATMRNVKAHLRVGGYFLFDVTLDACYEKNWEGEETAQLGERQFEIAYRYDRETKVATCEIRSDDHRWEFEQRPMSITAVERHLNEAGFAVEATASLDSMNIENGRTIVLARCEAAG
ncbi:methyltransferase [Bryobacterales bacterium F-183]|nr:methyltransferase [Bryobacterales bacterium F-183]